MQQALPRRGSNRNFAVGGLEEASLKMCACASQKTEEGGGSNIGTSLGREGRGHLSRSRERSARSSRHAVQAADTDGSADAAGRTVRQIRNNPVQQEFSCGAGEGADVVMPVLDVANRAEIGKGKLEAHGDWLQNAWAATRGGGSGANRADGHHAYHRAVAAGDLTENRGQKRSSKARTEQGADQEVEPGADFSMHASQRVMQQIQV